MCDGGVHMLVCGHMYRETVVGISYLLNPSTHFFRQATESLEPEITSSARLDG